MDGLTRWDAFEEAVALLRYASREDTTSMELVVARAAQAGLAVDLLRAVGVVAGAAIGCSSDARAYFEGVVAQTEWDRRRQEGR